MGKLPLCEEKDSNVNQIIALLREFAAKTSQHQLARVKPRGGLGLTRIDNITIVRRYR